MRGRSPRGPLPSGQVREGAALAILRPLPLLAFIAVLGFLAVSHEPWRDEADAWLMARDASLAELFHLAGNAGTPVLWYLLQMPFAKLGFPFETQKIIHLAIAAGMGAVLWLRAPFPVLIRLLALFGFYLSFEYGVVARSYSLTALLLFLAASARPDRARQPLLYGALLALLANTNAHGFVIVAVLLCWEAVRLLLGEQPAGAWKSGALAGAGVVAAFLQLLPPKSAQIPQLFANTRNWGAAVAALPSAFLPTYEGRRGAILLGVILAAGFLASLLCRPRFLILVVLLWSGLLYIFVFKFVAGLRHYGFILLAALFVAWLAEEEPSPLASPSRKGGILRRTGTVALAISLAISCTAAARAWSMEARFAFSEAAEMAGYLRGAGLDDATIAGFPAPHCSAVLPYLRTRSLWYPGIEDFGSYMKWDRAYLAGVRIDPAEAVRRFRARFPRHGEALFLTNAPLYDSAGSGLRLLHRTPGLAFAHPDETFFLYEATGEGPGGSGVDPFRASVEVLETPRSVHPGAPFSVRAVLRNDSDTAWPAWGRADEGERVNVSYHWRTAEGDIVTFDGRRTALPMPLRPGEAVTLDVGIDAPSERGSYLLELDLVWENVAWFSNRGAPGPRFRVEVGGNP